jgi:hypothetical protein
MEYHQIWKVAEEAWGALNERFEPVMLQESMRHGMDQHNLGLLLAVCTFQPEDTTAGHLMVRSPYTAAEAYNERLKQAASKGWLLESAPGCYRMTEEGRTITFEAVNEAREEMAKMDPLPPADSGRLAVLLDRLVAASMSTPPPPNTWSINLSYKLVPGLYPPMPYIEQAFSCLAAYRDDAHLAAWQRSGLSAMALETLTYLWRGDASSFDELCKKLSARGHPCQVYTSVLSELREQGFITGPDKLPWVTGTGRVFRNEIEADTDRFFYAPWFCLEDHETNELFGLLTRMRDGLR